MSPPPAAPPASASLSDSEEDASPANAVFVSVDSTGLGGSDSPAGELPDAMGLGSGSPAGEPVDFDQFLQEAVTPAGSGFYGDSCAAEGTQEVTEDLVGRCAVGG